MFVFPQPSVVQTVLLAARRNMVLPSWTWNIGMSWPDAHGCGPACGHLLGITMARHLTWLELGTMKHKRLSDHPAENVGLPHARKKSEIFLLCCNPAVGTVDPLDAGIEHQRTAATCLHLGRWKNILFKSFLKRI